MYHKMCIAFILIIIYASHSCRADMPYLGNKSEINICTSSYTPMVSCGDTSRAYTGYEIEVFARVYTLLGWRDNQVNYTCMDWDDMLDLLKSKDANKTCTFAVAGVGVNTDRINLGITFSWPTYRNGLSIAIKHANQQTSIWAAFYAFSATVWIATIGTSIAIGLIVWGIDKYMHDSEQSYEQEVAAAATSLRKDILSTKENSSGTNTNLGSLQEYIVSAIGRPMQMKDVNAVSIAGNIIMIVFSFVCLVLVALYTASTTANFTATRLQSTINGLTDLPGKAVGTFEEYVPQLKKYGIAAAAYPWNNDEDETAMFDALMNGTIQALILDTSILQYRAANNCEIAIVGDSFDMFDQAMSFPLGFNNPKLLNAINEALVKLQEDGTLSMLQGQFIEPPLATCKTNDINSENKQISFSDVAGLWVLILCSLAVALVILIVHKLHVRYTRKKLRTVKKVVLSTARSLTGSGRRKNIDLDPSVVEAAQEVMGRYENP